MLKRLIRQNVHDRRASAIHEAGHIVICRHVGVFATGYIYLRGDPTYWEKAWVGQTSHRRLRLPALQKRMIGVAGEVAVLCARKDDELECLDLSEMSETDATLLQLRGYYWDEYLPTRRAVEATYALLNRHNGRLWPAVCREARLLIEESNRYHAGLLDRQRSRLPSLILSHQD